MDSIFNAAEVDAVDAVDDMSINPIVGAAEIEKATEILLKYKQGKANLEQRIIDNDKWYRLRHWDGDKSQIKPSSAWLFNCIENKHADFMDNFPSPSILPRESNDEEEAERLSSIIPVILETNDFEKTYNDVSYQKLKYGTGVYGVFWDAEKLNGLGDINVRCISLLNLFWEPGIKDIQNSANLFCVELFDNKILEEKYPELYQKLSTQSIQPSTFFADDTIDYSDKSLVIDWYYKKKNSDGKTVLHYVKYVNDTVLFATENDPEMLETGLYDHGRYPFEFDALFPIENSPAGFGYIDVGKDTQEYIDRLNRAVLENTLANTKPRHFIRSDGSVNEREYADMDNDFIHVDGALGQDSIIPVNGKPLSGIYLSVLQTKIEELKETTGNRDISTGGTSSGVTAASAIAAMQEAGSKLSRDANKSSYRVFKRVCLIVIELIRQFYDNPRQFRIIGDGGAIKFINFSNAKIKLQEQGMTVDVDMGYRLPLFDVSVCAEKQSPYSRISQNELALQFYQMGFFAPENSGAALACLDMMDFDRKDILIGKIQQNAANYFNNLPMMPQMGGVTPTAQAEARTGEVKENSFVENARRRVAESTSPR